MVLDLGESQFLAELVALPAVAGEVDRLRVKERFVEPVELLLDRLDSAFLLHGPFAGLGMPLLPNVKDAVFDQAHSLGFRACGRLTRQVIIDGIEDDEVLMEYFCSNVPFRIPPA